MMTKDMAKWDFADFPLKDSYVEKKIMNGEKRNCSYPQNGVPKTKISEERIPSPLIEAFGLNKNQGGNV